MYPFRKILFPVDYSEPCEAIVPYVLETLSRFSGDLSLVHAYGGDALGYREILSTDRDFENEMRAREDRRLRKFAQEIFPGRQVACFVERGEAGAAVHKVVQQQNADVVMLPTHGLGPVRRFLTGSVTAKILHDVSCAVWTGTGAALMNHKPRIPYQSILSAVDGRDDAEQVLKFAAALAATYQAQLSLVHVVQTPPAAIEVDFAPYRKELVNEADFRLRELKEHLGIDVHHAVVESDIADGVAEEALRRRADLIVTGRGLAQGTITRMWAHVYPIIRQSPCPVLSV